ncbi:hypothetical protein H0H81_001573 [Sphagnurus paluster]|uniref:Uncharacterized protein n=1 Tax=Sphagnurus paluster TaxID=117069 RepID=A0A9P7K937_9AGAR|nr:hypothetical protein H0H81_001573 [Sphagnurus paluster]
MSTMDLLRANFERLMQQYNTNVHAILALQATLIRDILPSVSDELELGPDATEWAKEWLEDTYTIFRISRVREINLQDYGGTLAPLALLDDPLRTGENPLEIMDPNYNQIRAADPLVSPLPASTSLSPTSHLNPFFGYPASSSYGSLSLHHGRRRKRDLAQTLAVLFWMRWRKPLVVGIFFTVCAIVFKVASRGARVRSLRIFLGQKWPLSFKLGSK